MRSDASEWLHAAFASAVDAREALEQLARAGVRPEDIETRSSAPDDPPVAPAGAEPTSHVPRNAVLGGLVGGGAMFMLVALTARASPLRTGAMRIVALPPAGILTFEGVAIGAIACTVATVLRECGLPSRRRHGPLDWHLAEDHVLVSVRCTEDASQEWASRALEVRRG